MALASCAGPAPIPGPPASAPGHTASARIEVAAPKDAVYRALTEGSEIQRWAADRATTRPVEGGELWLGFRNPGGGEEVAARGLFLALIPPKRITFRIVYPQEIGLVRGIELPGNVVHETDVVIESTGERACAVTVSDRIDASAPLSYVESARQLWSVALLNLKSILEGGPDLRAVR